MRKPVRVLVVEDSLVQQARIVSVLEADGDITVAGRVGDAREAVAQTRSLHPDVVTMDLEIPGGGGHWAIEQIMGYSPTPILVLSSHVRGPHSTAAVEALVAGALDALPKPDRWTPEVESALRSRVRTLSGVRVITHPRARLEGRQGRPAREAGTAPPIVAIGASTGGPAAVAAVIKELKGLTAPVLLVQHLHADFVEGFVEWLGREGPLDVVIAEQDAAPHAGTIYVAPGGTHLRLGHDGHLHLDPRPDAIHRPAVDELFSSVAANAGASAIGVLLTGMGDDGASGLAKIHTAGGRTIAQDEATSAVFGMPRAAQRLGAVDQMLPLGDIGRAIERAVRRGTR